MKQKMTVIMDKNGAFLGAVRNGAVQHGKDTVEFFALPHPDHTHRTVEIDEEEMMKPFAEMRDMLLSKISGK